jgi:hypothetical protein
MNPLHIVKIDTKKSGIYQRPLMKAKIIPHHSSVSIFSGSQGSGKSTLVNNFLSNKMMLKGYYDAIFLVIGSDDDMYDGLIEQNVIKKQHVIKDPTSDKIQMIIDNQKASIQKVDDISKAPKILIIFDDVQNNLKLMNSKAFLECFTAPRHMNASIFMLCQYINILPKKCRLQANYLFIFKSSKSEMDVLCDQFCLPDMTKKEFCKMLLDVTKDTVDDEGNRKVNFLLITKGSDDNKRFRKNLDEYILRKGVEAPKVEIDLAESESDEEKQENKEKDEKKLETIEKEEITNPHIHKHVRPQARHHFKNPLMR